MSLFLVTAGPRKLAHCAHPQRFSAQAMVKQTAWGDLHDSLLGTKEVAKRLGVSERTVLKIFRSGKMDAFQIDSDGSPRLWRVSREALHRYLDERKAAARRS